MSQRGRGSGNKTGASAKSGRAGQKGKPSRRQQQTVSRTVGAVICLFLGLFTFIGYFDVDAWFIRLFCGFTKGLVGWGYYILPPFLLLSAFTLGFQQGKPVALRLVSALLLPLFFGTLAHMLFSKESYAFSWEMVARLYADGERMTGGGVLAGFLAILLETAFSIFGAVPLCLFAFVIFAMLSVNLTPRKIAEIYGNRPPKLKLEKAEPAEALGAVDPAPEADIRPRRLRHAIDIPLDEKTEPQEEYTEERVGFFNKKPRVKTPDQVIAENADAPFQTGETFAAETVPPSPQGKEDAPVSAPPATDEIRYPPKRGPAAGERKPYGDTDEAEDISKKLDYAASGEPEAYAFPPVDLLRKGDGGVVDGREEINLNRERLESTIKSFGIGASVTGITRGPTVTRYDLELEAGVKLNKLTNLAGDLALSLGVVSVRIAPIPDKISTVGVEVPNKLVSLVYLHDIIDSASFRNAASKLTFAIGKDIAGNCIVGNIAKLPHMLIAGTTGSGKSVCMNSLILSLLYKATPDEVRLIMIDPKMVELGIYNGIPHLYIPVVTDPKKAAGALQWAVVEMMKRYRLFSELGVRDLAGYNAYKRKSGETTLPQVVIVIDELADLMLAASKEVEESICRVAQMGRASGMHLIIATQRPSADVITGLMKANIPSRIAFAVSSAMESRIILDQQGAEKLIGMGDMLYSPLGSGKPIRVQGAFVSDEEREKVIAFIKESSEACYSDEIMAQIEKAAEDKPAGNGNGGGGGKESPEESFASQYDELLPQAVDVIFETKQASVSMLQRRLKLGYSRAARLVDQMEELGVVGPFEGSKPRQILITPEQWREMQYANGLAPQEKLTDEPPFLLRDDENEDL